MVVFFAPTALKNYFKEFFAVEPFLYIPHSKVTLSQAVEERNRDMHAYIYLSINVVGRFSSNSYGDYMLFICPHN